MLLKCVIIKIVYDDDIRIFIVVRMRKLIIQALQTLPDINVIFNLCTGCLKCVYQTLTNPLIQWNNQSLMKYVSATEENTLNTQSFDVGWPSLETFTGFCSTWALPSCVIYFQKIVTMHSYSHFPRKGNWLTKH